MFKLTRLFLRHSFHPVRRLNNLQQKPLIAKETITTRIDSIMRTVEIKSQTDWDTLKNSIIGSSKFINAKNLDALMIQYFTTTEKYELGEKYFDYLLDQKKDLPLGVLGKYFRFYFYMKNNKAVTNRTDRDIIEIYSDIRKKYPVLDSVTCEHLICGLSLSEEWRECIRLLDETKITTTPSTEAYSLTISAAFSHNEDDLGFKLLEEMILKNRTPQTRVYTTYLQNCLGQKEKIEKLFYFFEAHDITCDPILRDEILESLRKEAKLVKISPKGDCLSCRKRLQRLYITDNEFRELKKAFFQRAIIGKNVYNKTSEEEVERFRKFIDGGQKYDVIIDGLNVAYTAGRATKSVAVDMIAAVVNHFNYDNQKILVIGRKHMENWNGMDRIKRMATVFLTENLSYDDPFLLYCALNSGLKTTIISNDLMRSHLFLLRDLKLKRLFSKWLGSCQHMLLRVNKIGRPVFSIPSAYLKTPQKDNQYWHLPCKGPQGDENNIKDWICIKF